MKKEERKKVRNKGRKKHLEYRKREDKREIKKV